MASHTAKRRVILAFGLAPLVPGLVAALFVLAGGSDDKWIQAVAVTGTVSVLAYGLTLLIGLPLYLLRHKTSPLSPTRCSVTAAVLASLPSIAMSILLVGSAAPYDQVWQFPLMTLPVPAAVGAMAGFVFWMIAVEPHGRWRWLGDP
jgi:ABC-type amino acid transport system permease subunit